jgi:hypothetical protein
MRCGRGWRRTSTCRLESFLVYVMIRGMITRLGFMCVGGAIALSQIAGAQPARQVTREPSTRTIAFIRTMKLIGATLCLVLPALILVGCAAPRQAFELVEAPAPAIALERGQDTDRTIGAGETHAYTVDLERGSFLHAVVEPAGIDSQSRVARPPSTRCGSRSVARMGTPLQRGFVTTRSRSRPRSRAPGSPIWSRCAQSTLGS